MERDFLIITHDDHRNFRTRADLGHLIHRLQRRDGGFVIHGDDYVVGADPGLSRWTVRGHIVNDDPLNLIDPPPCACSGRSPAANADIAADHPAIADQFIHNFGR